MAVLSFSSKSVYCRCALVGTRTSLRTLTEREYKKNKKNQRGTLCTNERVLGSCVAFGYIAGCRIVAVISWCLLFSAGGFAHVSPPGCESGESGAALLGGGAGNSLCCCQLHPVNTMHVNAHNDARFYQHTHRRTHARTHARTHTHTHTSARTHTHTSARTHTHTRQVDVPCQSHRLNSLIIM